MKTEIKYGLLFAGIVMVYVMIEHVLGFNTTRHDIGQYTRLMGVIVPILGIFFGIRKRRKIAAMTFAQGVKTGFWIAFIQTTLTTLWFLLYSEVINPEFVDTMLEFERSRLVSLGTPEPTMLERLAEQRSFFAFPRLQIFQELFGIAYGVVFAMIFSFFLRTKSKPQ